MNWMVLVGSLAAVFAVAGMVWLLGMGKAPVIGDAEQAMQLARDAHSGFHPKEAVVDGSGRAALVHGDNGEVVLVRPHGAQIAARVFKEKPDTKYENGQLHIATEDRMFGDIVLSVDEQEAERWTDRLGTANHA